MTEEQKKSPPFVVEEDGTVTFSGDVFEIEAGSIIDLRIGNLTQDQLREIIREEITAAARGWSEVIAAQIRRMSETVARR